LHSYTILVALLFVSFGFTSAYADETFVDPDSGGVNDGDEIINGLDPLKRNDDRLLL